MARYDAERMERATRDVVARAGYTEIVEGRGTERGGVFIDVSHLGRRFVRRKLQGAWSSAAPTSATTSRAVPWR